MKNFIDLLFILLICAVVLLSESIRVGAVETAPPTVTGQSDTPLASAQEIRVVVVNDENLILDEEPFEATQAVLAQLKPGDTVLLVSGTEDVKHHRMMAVWAEISGKGFGVKLGVQPTSAEGGGAGDGAGG